ncbi:STAS domain-containing protein [Actinomadura chibensis]|uniref:Anti-sigma factor antagonist n=1 Tax=Actinomadura chibensis TaxID=392828 RepID=A0A5D0N6Y7_9ACTN|nr:STAS domain-containing protein [Actinomadura chibensis]TYB40138.1 STAS domain-containing protein [Actinomadura chibensis]
MGAILQGESEQFATVVKSTGGPPRVFASGELDLASAADFGRELTRLIDERGPDVVVDVSSLAFCDARGLAAFVAAERAARRRGGGITLAGVRPQLAKILRITGLDRTFARRTAL